MSTAKDLRRMRRARKWIRLSGYMRHRMENQLHKPRVVRSDWKWPE